MISMILPLSVGNALRVFLEPPSDAVKWRLLRKGADSFSGHDDPGAFLVHEGNEKFVVDSEFLQNDIPQFYRAYYWNGSDWAESNTATGTARVDYGDGSSDAQLIVRDRLEWGLVEEVRRGVLRPQSGSIAVLTAPPVWEDSRWPMVTVSMVSEMPAERGIGEVLEPDDFDLADWSDNEGWLARVQLGIIGWCQNPDERIALRQAIRRLIVANLPVFEHAGLTQIEFAQNDIDAVEGEYPAPVYQTAGTFTCLAPVIVGGRVPAIADVFSKGSIYDEEG